MDKTKSIAIKCENIMKSYGVGDFAQLVLNGISVNFFCGQLTFLMGASGCGKTTLLSILSTILTEDSGSIEIFGQNFKHFSEEQKTLFRCKNIGFLFQSFYLIPSLTAVENVEIPLLLQGYSSTSAREKATATLEEIGIAELASKAPLELSGGQQQRIALARAIVHRPKLIICDEPTSALDHKNGIIVMDLLKTHALNPENTVVLATHDKRILEYSDRVVELNDGKIEKIY